MHAQQGDDRNGIRSRSRGVLEWLAANIQSPEQPGIDGAIEKASALFVRVAIEDEIERALRRPKIARVEGEFVGVKQGQHTKHLIVEAALQRGTANAMSKSARF